MDFRTTYDGEEEEPIVLPANFPNLLANGTTGIAVGMATSIPPHNVGELCDGLLHLIKAPNARLETLMEKIPAPDFPTGGSIVEDPEAIRIAYETGKGTLRVRANWAVEQLERGQYQIVITQIPYQVQKSRLIERAADLLNAKKLPLIDEIHDESAEDVRIVITPKNRNVAPEVLMEMLYKQTELENRFSINLNVLDKNNVPRVMGLRELLQAFLDHRREVLVRKSTFRLEQIAHRLEVLAGYLIVFLNLDEVIAIIREEDEPKPVMMKRFTMTDMQVEAVLNMRLRSLRRLEEIKLKQEFTELEVEEKTLKTLVKDEEKQWAAIADQVRGIKKQFADKRRTVISAAPPEIEVSLDDFVEKEPVTIICSAAGWVRAARGHAIEADTLKYKEGDTGRFLIPAMTTDKVLVFTSAGKFYTLGVDKLPGARGFGEPLSLMIDMDSDHEVVDLFILSPDQKLLIASSDGRGFIVSEKNVMAQTRGGKHIMTVKPPVKAKRAIPIREGDTHVAVVGSDGKMIIFPVAEVSEVNKGRGVILQRYKGGTLTDVTLFNMAEGLKYMSGGRETVLADVSVWTVNRGGQGRNVPKGFPKSGRFLG